MDDKQKINCTVESCKYNNCDKQLCELKQIVVSPTPNCNTTKYPNNILIIKWNTIKINTYFFIIFYIHNYILNSR